MPEIKKSVVATVTTSTNNSIVDLLHKFSNLNKICRIISYCLRFFNSHDSQSNSISVSHEEASTALNILCKLIQQETFYEEIKILKSTSSRKMSSSLASFFTILRLQWDNSCWREVEKFTIKLNNYNARHPILLPRTHRLTQLVIEREHIRNLHAGLQGTIACKATAVRPLSIRSTTRSIIRKCITCFKCKPMNSEAIMGIPPRVVPSRPFSNCGVDYAGPLVLREGKRRNARNQKAYIYIFVCLATKTIHIELVSDLTSESFLASLKRFISRRGNSAYIPITEQILWVHRANCQNSMNSSATTNYKTR